MKNTFLSFLLSYLLLNSALVAQLAPPFAKWTNSELLLNNGVVQRTINLPAAEGPFQTTLYKPVEGDFRYFLKTNPDFQFELNDTVYSGTGAWRLVTVQKITDTRQGDGAAVTLQSKDGKVEVIVRFLLYPDLPVIRKSLIFKNLTTDTVRLESVDVEKFSVTGYFAPTYSWVCGDYGRRRTLGPYEGTMQDALLTVHDPDSKQGIVIGNEASGVMKRTAVFWEAPEICAGLTHKTARFPFRKWLAPGQSFETPQVFTMVYNTHDDPDEILNTAVPVFIRKHLGIRLSELAEKPTFVYNTWKPFKEEINEKLVYELATAAAKAGMKEFVIDGGWQDSYGDWGIDKKKFPNGLKPVIDHIKSLGMKPGLWVSIGTAAPDSKVYRNHPEWFVEDKDGKPISLVINDPDKYTACFGTGWYDYIKGVLSGLVTEYGLEYLKLDFSVVTSPYRFDPVESGCYAHHHAGHKDHHEALYTNYEPMWRLFDELHVLKPNLFIDCTFETMGGLQLIDYAMLKHAEGNWLSNFYEPNEKGDLRVRNMAWWRSPAMPATALVIGNPSMEDLGWENHIKSLAGALPIMLGDPRKLSESDLKKYRRYADWLQAMQAKHDFMSYRQDLAGFGEPMEGMWDGFQRINTDSKRGGIVGVFRHGAAETTRRVMVKYLDPLKKYQVKTMDGKVIASLSGQALQTNGFAVSLTGKYSGELFEVSL
ncbi:MAG: alpha-galactosidase [Sphingobacteriaceae bacterium]|nr:alpha-galactosidase [Cytophagaceae bacterium]